jgi:hypothetical protein
MDIQTGPLNVVVHLGKPEDVLIQPGEPQQNDEVARPARALRALENSVPALSAVAGRRHF